MRAFNTTNIFGMFFPVSSTHKKPKHMFIKFHGEEKQGNFDMNMDQYVKGKAEWKHFLSVHFQVLALYSVDTNTIVKGRVEFSDW